MNSQKRNNIQTTILALLVARRGGSSLSQLSEDYYEQEGEQIPWREFGYVSLLNFLQSMDKVIQIENKYGKIMVRGIGTAKSKHVSKLVHEQKSEGHKHASGRKTYKPSHYYPNTGPHRMYIPAEVLAKIVSLINEHPDGVNKDYILNEIRKHMPFIHITLKEMEEQLQQLSHKVFIDSNKIFPIQSRRPYHSNVSHNSTSTGSEYMASDERKWNSTVVTAGGNEDLVNVSDYEDETDFQFMVSDCINNLQHTKSNKPISSFIKETVSKCQEQTRGSRSEESTHRTKTNQDKLHNEHDYHCCDNAQVCFEFNNNIVGENNKCLDSNNFEVLINERVKLRLKKLIQCHPEGIWCADLPEMYLEEFKVSLNYTELGFNSVREFASYLPEIFHCIQPYDTGDFILYDGSKEVPLKTSKEKQKSFNYSELHQINLTDDIEPIPVTVSLNTCKDLIPDNVMTIGESVDHLNITSLISEEKPYIEVYVVEVFTPSFFWIQLRKMQKIFLKLMDDLNDFYISKHEEYEIQPVVLEKGLNCACVYNGVWHRGIIQSINHDLQVTVMFYDYGTLKTYPPDAVHYLHKTFSLLPAQAIPCGLINTRPRKGSKWSQRATHYFAVRTSRIPLIATVASMNIEDNSMMVTLTDTLDEEDVHINDWLVEQKLAEHGKMVCIKNRNFPFRYYLQCRKRIKQKFKRSRDSKVNTITEDSTNYSHMPVTLYDTTFHVESSSKRTMYKVNGNNLNSVLSPKRNNKVESSKSLVYSTNSSEQKSSNNVRNSGGRLQKKLSTFKKLLGLKEKPYFYKNGNSTDENDGWTNESSSTDEVLDKPDNQKLNDGKPHTFSTMIPSSHDEEVFSLSNEDYDILKEYTNIPKAYANHFHIRNSDDESDSIDYLESNLGTHDQNEFKSNDWSAVRQNSPQRRVYTPLMEANDTVHKSVRKKRDDITLPEDCFLEISRNSTHFAARDKDIHWSPNGNINNRQDAGPLMLRNVRKLESTNAENMIVAIPQETLKILTGEGHGASKMELSKSFSDTSEGSSTSLSTSSYNETSNSTIDDSEIQNSSSNSNVDVNRLESNVGNIHSFENYYVHMRALTPKYKLLRSLLKERCTTNSSEMDSDIDSDDVSILKESASFSEDNNNSKTEFDTIDCTNDSLVPSNETKNTVLDVQSSKLEEAVLSNNFNLGEETTLIEQPVLTEKLSLVEEPVSTAVNHSLLAQKQTLLEAEKLLEMYQFDMEIEDETQVGFLESDREEEEDTVPLLETSVTREEREDSTIESVETDLVPLRDSPLTDSVEPSSIPTFNDIDIESDEEEWDVHISFDGRCELVNSVCTFIKDTQSHRIDYDTGPKIVEVCDSNLSDKADVEHSYKNKEGQIVEIMHPKDTVENNKEPLQLCSENEEAYEEMESISAETPDMFRKESPEVNDDTSCIVESKVPRKIQGKASTLMEMLAKAKHLRVDKSCQVKDKVSKVDMSSLLLYVEENMLFAPAKCYDNEQSSKADNEKESSVENSENAPLISPQSTLCDNPIKPPGLLPQMPNLTNILEERLSQPIPQDNPTATAFSPSKINTNPFLQDTSTIASDDTLSPQQFIQLLSENLQLQMQITSTFNMILNKVVKHSPKTMVDNLLASKDVPNTSNNTFSYTQENNSSPTNSATPNVFNTYPNTVPQSTNNCASTNATAMNRDFQNIGHSYENLLFMLNSYRVPFYSTSGVQNPDANIFANDFQHTIDNLKSTCFKPADSNTDAITHTLNNVTPTIATTPPENLEKFNSVNDDTLLSLDKGIDDEITLNETNPFRLSLAGKLKIPGPFDENDFERGDSLFTPKKTPENVMQNDINLIDFEKQMTSESFTDKSAANLHSNRLNQQEYFSNISNDANNVSNNAFTPNKKSLNPDSIWSMDNLTNGTSKGFNNIPSVTRTVDETWKSNESELQFETRSCEFLLDTPPYLGCNSQEHFKSQDQKENVSSKPCFPSSQISFGNEKVQYFKENDSVRRTDNFTALTETPDSKRIVENDVFATSNVNLNRCAMPSWTNNFTAPLLIDSTNVDEGYSTRPPTSHASNSSSPFWQVSSEVEYNDNSPTRIAHKTSESTFETRHLEKPYYLFEKLTESVNHDGRDSSKEVNNSVSPESEFKNGRKCKNSFSENPSPLRNKVFFQVIELSKQIIHVFHHKGQGWMLINEFVSVFTAYKTTSDMLRVLSMRNIRVPCEEIDRTEYTVELFSFNSTLPKVTQDLISNAKKIHLISIKTALKLLSKLDIISGKEISIAFARDKCEHGSIMQQLLIVTSAYKLFKHDVENENN